MEKVIKGLGFINLLIISVISLAYGALHSLGPGHGKAIVASYFLKRPDAGKKDVLKVILISSLGHNLSALAIGSLMAIVAGFGNQQNQSLIRSYALLATGIIAIIFGVYLVAKKIVKGNAYSSCGQRANERNDENKEKKYGLLTVGIISGIVPCPLSVAVVFFGFYIKSYIAVFLSVLFMSAGMAFTQGLFGFASLKASSYAAKKANTNKKIYTLLHSFFEYAGACAILIIGLLTVGAFFIS
jgi:ABC-type nickel/cobalt efflux system permease component RcnA